MENNNSKVVKDNSKPYTIYIEGIGKGTEVGKLNVEKYVELLLKTKSITG